MQSTGISAPSKLSFAKAKPFLYLHSESVLQISIATQQDKKCPKRASELHDNVTLTHVVMPRVLCSLLISGKHTSQFPHLIHCHKPCIAMLEKIFTDLDVWNKLKLMCWKYKNFYGNDVFLPH